MSYDFRLFLPLPGIDALIIAQTAADEEADEINPGPPVPAKETRKQSIAAALIKSNRALVICEFAFDRIATSQGTTIEEAKMRFRHLELNGPEDGNGIQITLFDDGASLTVPYWHKGKSSTVVFSEIWDYLKVIQQVGGYQIYDLQMECIVDLALDFDTAVKCYSDVVKTIG